MNPVLLRLAALCAALLLAVSLPRLIVGARFARAIDAPEDAPPHPTAIVFGAGLRRDGAPTAVLSDRIRTAVALYQRGAVQQILLSGSDLDRFGDETRAMRDLALDLGVPEAALLLDPKGHRTYASCANARHVFGVRQAVLVTQRYHLPRALAICQALGIEARGVSADLSPYSRRAMTLWRLREIPATLVALWDAYLRPPQAPFPPEDAVLGCGDWTDHGS